jgi:predicted transcriptional regulator
MLIKYQYVINIVMSEELNEMVGSLLEQLSETSKKAEQAKKESNPLTKENMEKFVVEKAGRLVEESLDVVSNVKEYISSAPESKDVGSLAELIAATSSALETLNKIIVTDKRNETLVKTKTMDIEARKGLKDMENTAKLLITREQVFKMLIENANNTTKVIEAEAVQEN